MSQLHFVYSLNINKKYAVYFGLFLFFMCVPIEGVSSKDIAGLMIDAIEKDLKFTKTDN